MAFIPLRKILFILFFHCRSYHVTHALLLYQNHFDSKIKEAETLQLEARSIYFDIGQEYDNQTNSNKTTSSFIPQNINYTLFIWLFIVSLVFILAVLVFLIEGAACIIGGGPRDMLGLGSSLMSRITKGRRRKRRLDLSVWSRNLLLASRFNRTRPPDSASSDTVQAESQASNVSAIQNSAVSDISAIEPSRSMIPMSSKALMSKSLPSLEKKSNFDKDDLG